MLRLLAFLESIPRPIVALAIFFGYMTVARWRARLPMLIDAALIVLYLARPSIGLLAWVALLMIVRHTPTLARDVALMLGLHEYAGWTARAVLFALPALAPDAIVMSRSEDGADDRAAGTPVHVPVPGTALVSGESAPARDIRDDWIVKMASARDEKGKYLYSANDIFKANGGHRASVLARVKEIQTGDEPAQFRQDDGAVAPADYPISKSA